MAGETVEIERRLRRVLPEWKRPDERCRDSSVIERRRRRWLEDWERRMDVAARALRGED